jgi:hypothetical protein
MDVGTLHPGLKARAVLAALAILCCAPPGARAQDPSPLSAVSAGEVFEAARSICRRDRGRLWGRPLCGPVMLVDPRTRRIVANRQDPRGALRPEGNAFTGTLPLAANMANTAASWSGLTWTQMLWPLPGDDRSRRVLIAHELFHRLQPELGLPVLAGGEDNRHLGTLEGRYLIQLEWRALSAALAARAARPRRQAVRDALLFRAQRYRLFPEAAGREQALEYNEGLAEYTGVRAGTVSPAEAAAAAQSDLDRIPRTESFVRSFAYASGPAYGLLLDRYLPGWRRRLASGPRLDSLLAQGARIALPPDLAAEAAARAPLYGGPALRAAEIERDARHQRLLADYRRRFVDGPVLSIRLLDSFTISFDPRSLQAFGERGTVYPTARIVDAWGVLEASGGLLLTADRRFVIVAGPVRVTGNRLEGDGWTLDLDPRWRVVPGLRAGDFVLAGPD